MDYWLGISMGILFRESKQLLEFCESVLKICVPVWRVEMSALNESKKENTFPEVRHVTLGVREETRRKDDGLSGVLSKGTEVSPPPVPHF